MTSASQLGSRSGRHPASMSSVALLATARVHRGAPRHDSLPSNIRTWPSALRAMCVSDVTDRPARQQRWLRDLIVGEICSVATTVACALWQRQPGRGRDRSSASHRIRRANVATLRTCKSQWSVSGAWARTWCGGCSAPATTASPTTSTRPRSQASEADGARGAGTPQQVVDALDRSATHLADGSRRVRRQHHRGVRSAAVARRHPDRRRQLVVPRRRRSRRTPARDGHQLPRRRYQWWRVRARPRLLLDGRRTDRRGRRDGADLRPTSPLGPASIERTPGLHRRSRSRPRRAGCTAGRTAPATSSRWSTTGSSTA